MKEHYVSYSQADKLKDLGFDWKCRYYYNIHIKKLLRDRSKYNYNLDINKCSAPRLDQVQAWLREVKRIHVYPEINCLKKWFANGVDMERNEDFIWDGTMYDTYELALSAGIDAALELLTNKFNKI